MCVADSVSVYVCTCVHRCVPGHMGVYVCTSAHMYVHIRVLMCSFVLACTQVLSKAKWLKYMSSSHVRPYTP